MFNSGKIKELERSINELSNEISDMESELRRVSRENQSLIERLFKLEYPNGKLFFFRNDIYCYQMGINVEFCFSASTSSITIGTLTEIPVTKNIEKLDDNKYLIQLDTNYFLVNTSTNQSIRVDKDMKVVL